MRSDNRNRDSRPFKVLRLIGNTYIVIGTMVFAFSIVMTAIFLFNVWDVNMVTPGESFSERYGSTGLCLLISFFTLFIIGFGQVIIVFLQIEENTRRIGNT